MPHAFNKTCIEFLGMIFQIGKGFAFNCSAGLY